MSANAAERNARITKRIQAILTDEAGADLLEAARDRLARAGGWMTGSLIDLTGRVCALGAVSIAAKPKQEEDYLQMRDSVEYPSDLVAELNGPLDAALRALDATRPVSGHDLYDDGDELTTVETRIYHCNDHPTMTQERCVSWFDAAIRNLRGE